jgi:hypothetical protein
MSFNAIFLKQKDTAYFSRYFFMRYEIVNPLHKCYLKLHELKNNAKYDASNETNSAFSTTKFFRRR